MYFLAKNSPAGPVVANKCNIRAKQGDIWTAN